MNRIKWFTASVYGFRVRPRASHSLLVFKEFGLIPIAIWCGLLVPGLVIAIDGTWSAFAAKTYLFRNPRYVVLFSIGVIWSLFAGYRLLRILLRRKRLVINSDTETATIFENWPRQCTCTCRLDRALLYVNPIVVTGGQGSTPGFAARVVIDDAFFVIGIRRSVDQVLAELPPQFADLNLKPHIDQSVILTPLPL